MSAQPLSIDDQESERIKKAKPTRWIDTHCEESFHYFDYDEDDYLWAYHGDDSKCIQAEFQLSEQQ